MEQRFVIVMYAGVGWSHLIPFLHLAKTLALHYTYDVHFLTHDFHTPGKNEYIQRVVSLCNGALIAVPATATASDPDQIASYLQIFSDCGIVVCAYIVDSAWTNSPEMASYHLNQASGIHGIRTYLFFRHSASFVCLALLKERMYQGNLGVSRVPGISSIASTDLPTAFLADQFPAQLIPRASALSGMHGIIINSWHELEREQIGALLSEMALPPIYAIGPLLPSWQMLPESDQEPETGAIAQFLYRQYARSVVFVYLGSVIFSVEQIRELAIGLEACGHPFLWALKAGAKPPFSTLQCLEGEAQSYSLSELLPEGFQNRTKNRGLIISCPPPQGYILSHPCTGAFVSHCGWNSTLQSILHGVPIIAWPVFDNAQKLNALVLLREMKAAIEARKRADGLVSGRDVERCCKVLMGGEEGGLNIRGKMVALSIQAKSAMGVGGSSYQAMTSLIRS